MLNAAISGQAVQVVFVALFANELLLLTAELGDHTQNFDDNLL
jgi:hypothetical protein